MAYEVIYESREGERFPFMRVAIPLSEKPGYVAIAQVRQLDNGRWTYLMAYDYVKDEGETFSHPVRRAPQAHEVFDTRDEAADASLAMIASMRNLGPMTRALYEELCTRYEFEPLPDSEIARHYSGPGGEYSPSEYGDNYRRMLMLFARAKQIKSERPQQPVRRIEAPAQVLADCGHYCSPALLMNATIGTSCPDCYDTSEERFGGAPRA